MDSRLDSPSAATEQAITRLYQQKVRLRSARQISFFLCLLLLGLVVVGLLRSFGDTPFAAPLEQTIPFTLIVALFALAMGGGHWLARQRRGNLAVIVVTATTLLATGTLAIVASFFLADLHVNTLAAFFVLLFGIIVTGLLASLAWLIGATLLANVYSVIAALVLVPRITAQPAVALLPLLVFLVLAQWICAALMAFNRMQYQRVIHDLQDAREAYARSQQLDDLKDQFISSVNHELRNPMMAMMNYVTILRQRHQDMPIAKRAEYLDSLQETGKRVTHLIGSILDVRQMTQHPEAIDPAYVAIKETCVTAAKLIDPAEAQMAQRSLLVEIPETLTIWGDAIYLQQIMTNLLSNAVKYSPAGTNIEVAAHLMAPLSTDKHQLVPQRTMVEITVRDYGLGVPTAQIPLLFNRFVRLPRDLTSRTIGNGLGLYLCKILAEAMDGQIWVESSGIEGEGSTFHLTLPAEPPPAPVADAAGATTIARVPLRQVRIAFGTLVALVLLSLGIAATHRPQAPAAPRVVAAVHFFDADGGNSNGIDLHVTGLSAPPAGMHYQAWIIDATSENIISLGSLTPANTAYVVQNVGAATGPSWLSQGNEVEITLEQQPDLTPVGKVLLSGAFPPKAIIHIRHLLVSFPATPGKVGLLVGLRTQTQLLVQLAQQVVDTGTHNPTLVHCLIRSQLAILEGQGGAPLPTTCLRLHILQGDGFGLLPQTAGSANDYLDGAIAHATLAFQQPDATPLMFAHGTHVVESLNHVKDQAQLLDAELRYLDVTYDASKAPTMLALAQSLLSGGATTAASGAGATFDSVVSAYTEGQLMADFIISSH
jgi:signal transduction histidine kinase